MARAAVMRWAHPKVYCVALPVVSLLLGALAATYQGSVAPARSPVDEAGNAPLQHVERGAWTWWASLTLGFAVGSGFAVPQRRLLHRYRDFVAEQSLRGHARGLNIELQWLRVLWPMLAALATAVGAAWWLSWPAVVALAGVVGAPMFLLRECGSIHTLAKRKVSSVGNP